MKKVSLLLAVMFLTSFATFAQDAERGKSVEAGRKATFTRNGFWDNWFIGAGAGANMYFGGTDQHTSFLDRMTVTPNFQFGKWYNPYFGARIKVEGGRVHTFTPRTWGGSGTHMDKFNMIHAQANFMFDVTNYLGKYNENRFYSFIPYVGAGWAYGWDYKGPKWRGGVDGGKQRSFTLDAGIINKFRLSNRLSLAIEVSASVLREDFDRRYGGKWGNDLMGNASASLIYKIGKTTDFQEAVLMDQGKIDDLMNQINRLRSENEKLSKRPEYCPECPKAETVVKKEVIKESGVSNVVFFRLNSAEVDKHQDVSIYNTAKYLQDNPNAKVKVVGYADKQTGTPAYNLKLSEKRAKNVANSLINKYKINSNRVVVEWKGDTEQPYAENAWNRVAIFVVE